MLAYDKLLFYSVISNYLSAYKLGLIKKTRTVWIVDAGKIDLLSVTGMEKRQAEGLFLQVVKRGLVW